MNEEKKNKLNANSKTKNPEHVKKQVKNRW